jgi:hypothetical protein
MQYVTLLKSFDGHNLAFIGLHSEHGAGFGRLAINENRTRAARRGITANMSSGKV